MRYMISMTLAAILLSAAAMAEVKTLSNDVLKEKAYERLEGDSDFRLGCRYLVRSENRAIVYRPTTITGIAISFNYGYTLFAVAASDKSSLLGTDGSVQPVTTWRNCAIF